ncbi:carbohydrate ABC transporter permease [Pseudobutyrivibrio sp.]|uniref:carbohydrate ABC transporter permease n=1 Tax=Pseudobutyrivibrio sp. TaxID=2014367 RepID=UPI001E17AF32|nr:carbohydrate ABC transporter permease [Pseudobutyrivibrio sp.]MBE5910059.1 carbohydrate ABC transporter permease [Pseudobutyrivibrio sp.]
MVGGRKGKIKSVLMNLIAILVSLIMIMPIVLIVINSFKTTGEAMTMTIDLPKKIDISNFGTVIEKGKLMRSFFNSLLYAGVSTAVTIVLGSMSAYVFSRRRNRSFAALYMYIVLGMVIPVNYVALMKVMQVMQLNNSALGIILLYVAIQTPFTIFLLYGFVSKIPTELDEAAIIDGCNARQLYFTIIMPLLKPAIVTGLVLCFLNTWNEFVMPLYFLNSSEKWPMTLAVYNFFGQFETSWNLICADVILTCAPVIIMYLVGQKYIVGGQTAGAVKG